MTKLQIIEELPIDWFDLAGMRKQAMLDYISALPDNVEFEVNYHGYDDADGTVFFVREETDEEYKARLKEEVKAQQNLAFVIAQKKADDTKNIKDAMAQLQKQLDLIRGD